MQRWEYAVVDEFGCQIYDGKKREHFGYATEGDALVDLGRQGWELVSAVGNDDPTMDPRLYFKRPAPQDAP